MYPRSKVPAYILTAAFFLCSATAFADSGAPSAPAQSQAPVIKTPIEVNGDKVEYFQEEKKVVGTGNVSITYQDVVLTCDQITVYLDKKEGIAEGHVKITQKDAYFTGEKISYNFETKKGEIIKGYINAKPFYGKADKIEKVAMKEQANLERGYVTTCDLEKPHYRVQARRVRIYLNDRVEAWHILMFVWDVPVLYFPYYVQSLKDTKTHITVTPGQSKEWGYYALTAYRLNLNDFNKADILLDYRSKKGLAEGINYYYDTRKIGDGAFKFYFTNEQQFAYEKTGEERNRYRFQERHRWDIEGMDTTAQVEFNKLSDIDVIKDYFYNEFEEEGDPDNYISFITTKRDYSIELLARKRFDKFFDVVERLPEVKINIPNFKVGDTPIYYKAEASGVYLNHTYPSQVPSVKDVDIVRFDTYNQLSYAARLFRALSVTPYAGIRDTYFSRNKWGDTNQIRTIFNAGVDNSIKFYRIYDYSTNWLGLAINKLRHIITPTANYYFTHQPTISPDNLNQFDYIDALDTQNGIKLALENKLQTKRGEGDNMKSVDLATLIVSTDFMFRLKDNNWDFKSDKFKSVDFQLELIPYSWAYFLGKMSINTKKYNIQTEDLDLVMDGGDKWSLALSHRYEDAETGTSNLFSMDGTYRINDKWKIRAYERFNMGKGSVEEQEYTVSRDLHCWIAEFTVDIKDNNDFGFWITLKLKAFPEYPIGLKRTFSRPRFGSTGDDRPQG